MGLNERKEALRKEIERKERHLASLEAMPDFEQLDNGTVLGLLVSLGRSRPYSFIAYKVADNWYLTGSNSPNGIGSDGLAEWLVTGGRRLHTAVVLAEFGIPPLQVIDLGEAIDGLLKSMDRDEMIRTGYPENIGRFEEYGDHN